MPPNEPVEESLEELLAQLSHETELEQSRTLTEPLYRLRMMHASGDWWVFVFQHNDSGWTLVGCSARSSDGKRPHDLLDSAYGQWFAPFLGRVTELVNMEEGF